VEAAELLEVFQWKSGVSRLDLTSDELRAVGHEIADVAIYLLSLCDVLDLELGTLILTKLAENERKYPVEEARGHAFPPRLSSRPESNDDPASARSGDALASGGRGQDCAHSEITLCERSSGHGN
jgi:hypothetical protein